MRYREFKSTSSMDESLEETEQHDPKEQQIKSLRDTAKRLRQQAKMVKARQSVTKAQQQLNKATQPPQPS